MKISKMKTFLLCLGATTLLTTLSVDATSLSIAKSTSNDTQAVYEVYLEPTEEVSNLTVKIQSSLTNIKPSIRVADNVDSVICNNDGVCALQGTYSTKVKIAEVTVENTSETQIDNLTISVSSEGIGNVSSDPINLKGKEVTTTTQKALSTKADFTNLTVSVGTMSPTFNVSEKNYTVNGIKDTVNSITFNPTCENCVTNYTCIENCTVSENKNNRIMLEDGANTIKITSTSEDGKNTTEYNFTVYRGEVEEPSAYLKELSIKDVEISPKFDMLLNDYTATVDLDVDKIEFDYTLEDPEATVDIKGADKLEEGENTITLTVTSSDGKSKQVYTITVTKEDICDPEKEECEEEEVKETVTIEKKKNNKTWLIVILTIAALTIIGVSGYFIFRKKKKDKNKDKDNKNDKSNKTKEKIKNMIIEPEETPLDEALLKTTDKSIPTEEKEMIKPKIKPSVDEALEDLMKTKEIELNNL